MSFKVAQVHRLRSATYLKQENVEFEVLQRSIFLNKLSILLLGITEAEQQLNICLQIYKLCLPPNSFHYLVTNASLGLIYKQQGHYKQALPLFQNISRTLSKDFLCRNL